VIQNKYKIYISWPEIVTIGPHSEIVVSLGVKIRIPKKHYGIMLPDKLPSGIEIKTIMVNTGFNFNNIPIKIKNISDHDVGIDFSVSGFNLYILHLTINWQRLARENSIIKDTVDQETVRWM
jgi:hypothetical protein